MKKNRIIDDYLSVGGIYLEDKREGMSTIELMKKVLTVILTIFNIWIYCKICMAALKIEELSITMLILVVIGMWYTFYCLESMKFKIINNLDKYV